MNVSAVIVTRGNVDPQEIIDSIPQGWEIVIWDNGEKLVSRSDGYSEVATDCSVYGRYAAIEYASHDLIYVQDDDVIVSDPQAIVDAWDRIRLSPAWTAGVACNMPQEFRHAGYTDSALVGFGAAFHRSAPARAFERFRERWPGGAGFDVMFNRTCDVVFTVMTNGPRGDGIELVDVPKVNREFAEDVDRMYRQPDHVGERARMLDLAREARDS